LDVLVAEVMLQRPRVLAVISELPAITLALIASIGVAHAGAVWVSGFTNESFRDCVFANGGYWE
jgi:hypothetical protein